MNLSLTKVYRFEKPTISGNRWEYRYEKKIFQDATFYINLNVCYFDKDQNLIKEKDYSGISDVDFYRYLQENSKHLIEEYYF